MRRFSLYIIFYILICFIVNVYPAQECPCILNSGQELSCVEFVEGTSCVVVDCNPFYQCVDVSDLSCSVREVDISGYQPTEPIIGSEVACDLFSARKNVTQILLPTPSPTPSLSDVCNPEDQIILYSENNCAGTIVGTLSVPQAGNQYQSSLLNQLCPLDNTISSLRFTGPIPAGFILEISDDPANLCSANYASIKILRNMGIEESWCIPAFESFEGITEGPDYYMRDAQIGTLDGQVSLFRVETPTEAIGTDSSPICFTPTPSPT